MPANQEGNREREIFEKALGLPVAEERAAFLREACGGDAALLARLEALLRAHAAAEQFLPGKPEGTVVVEPTLVLPVSESPGDRIGRYKLREKIGEGGCGVVYVAEQEEPVRRRVALKVIKLGMDTKNVVARFEAERQALAMMDHPNIAKVLDAGATETGRPYFVMELVRGIKITDYCDQNRLSTRERLELFIKVCQAVQHAHQKGIIHRDLKPSNILVTLHDGVPVPKVIDFGIAKATEGRLTDLTIYTELRQFLGTPAYMSPEQAELSGLDIDTRSDLYSLGVLLYELLTGKTPFETQALVTAGLDEMRRMIREQEPMRPSTRLRTMVEGELTTTAKQRSCDAPKLIHLLRGDLDWIVMKCLEKDRTRRYETANGLAMDVQRHLSQEAVLARPASKLYRLGRTLRRNKLEFTAAGALGALAVVLVLASWPVLKARLAKAALERLVLQSVPWEDGEELQLELKIAGAALGGVRLTANSGLTNGQRIWRLDSHTTGVLDQSYRFVEAEAETLRPVHTRFQFRSEAPVVDVAYHRDYAEIKWPGEAEPKRLALEGRVFDEAEFEQLARRLPLAPGYTVTLPLLCENGSRVLRTKITISGPETLKVRAGTYSCLRLQRDDGQTFWYSDDSHRYLVRSQAGTMTAELSTVRNLGATGSRKPPEVLLQEAPWPDGEEMRFKIKIAGVEVGSQRFTVRAGQVNAQKIWRLVQEGNGMRNSVDAQADTLKPIHSRYRLTTDADALDVDYGSDYAALKVTGNTEERRAHLDGPAFDNDEFFELVRRLPLAPGYKATLPLFTPIPGAAVPWELEVAGLETIVVPAGTFQCFKLKPFDGQSYWYSSDSHRYLVKFEVESTKVVGELSAVRQASLAEAIVDLLSQRTEEGLSEAKALALENQDLFAWMPHLGELVAAIKSARSLADEGNLSRGEAGFREAVTLWQRLISAQPGDKGFELGLAHTLQELGDLLARSDKAADATKEYQRGLQLAESAFAGGPEKDQAKNLRRSFRIKLGLENAPVVIAGIVPENQAQQIGLRADDVIISYAGQRIANSEELGNLTSRVKGSQLQLEILRDGHFIKFTAKEGRLGIKTEDGGPKEQPSK